MKNIEPGCKCLIVGLHPEAGKEVTAIQRFYGDNVYRVNKNENWWEIDTNVIVKSHLLGFSLFEYREYLPYIKEEYLMRIDDWDQEKENEFVKDIVNENFVT